MSAFAGTGKLLRFALRRDRVLLPSWIGVFVLMAVSSGMAVTDLYASEASRVAAVQSMNASPALLALYGRMYSTSLGALSLVKMTGLGAAMLAVFAFMVVVRHTRAEEESGRAELLGATAVGRYAILTSGLVMGGGASVVIGLLSGIGLASTGLALRGSMAFGLAWALTGFAFAAVGALTAQLTTGGRAASGIAGLFLGLAYVLRAVGDVSEQSHVTWFTWLSPIAWGQQVRAFAQERWSVLLLLLGFGVVTSVAAFVVAGRRDLGAGVLADRPGPARASPRLAAPLGLSWRLERMTVIAWAVSITLAGLLIGSIASQIGGMLDSPEAKDLIAKLGGTRAMTDAYLALELGMLGSIVTIFGMQAAMRMRSEEVALRAEIVLATAVGRLRWLGSHVSVALVGTAGILLLGGFGSAAGNAAQVGDTDAIGSVMIGALGQVPAAFVMVGIVVAVFGVAPRLTGVTWGVLVAFLLVGEFGALFELPRWMMDLSPFAHSPRIPGGSWDWGATLGLLAVAAALIALGSFAFQRRDIG